MWCIGCREWGGPLSGSSPPHHPHTHTHTFACIPPMQGNIKALTRELLDYLSVSDAEFKPDLTAKICTLIQR